MIAGGGMGRVKPTAIGPADEGVVNGVVDILVDSEAEAAEAARRYLAFFQARRLPSAGAADQDRLRTLVPANRRRTYEMRDVITTLADSHSFLELRRGFAPSIISGLCRVDGHRLGVLASSSEHLGGACDSDGALKAARFMELCDAFDVPLLFLCDTPGFMVGVEHERSAAVRKLARLFTVGASLRVPRFTIVTRRAYGLGAMAMMGGLAVGAQNGFHVGWPTAEMGPMNLEGAVALGFSKELAAAREEGGAEAEARLFRQLLEASAERAQALSVARTLETDDVIDPAESRDWVVAMVDAASAASATSHSFGRGERRRPCVSPW